jgi:beta-glucosidase
MEAVSEKVNFPQNFIWGCGTSPTQVEGETVNEWADFAAKDGTTPGDGPRHWRRYRFDFKCIGDMNLNAYRLGFDWGRLQKAPYEPLEREASLRYMEMLAELRSLGVEPFLTLFHFACPRWMAHRGGWHNKEAPHWFADFADRLAEMTDGEVRFWITHNEPIVYTFMSYILGEFPPQQWGRYDRAWTVLRNMVKGHELAMEKIRHHCPEAQIGITKHFKRFMPLRRWHPIDQTSSWVARQLFDRWGLKRFKHCDFVGVNYYGRLRMKGFGGVSPLTGISEEELEQHGASCDDMWEQDPAYLAKCLGEVSRRTGLPIYITENGVATMDEELRQKYLSEHLSALAEAIGKQVDVRGYFYWSLIDNFEWSEGMTKRFGLVSVDFVDENRRREIRPTGRHYARIARANAVQANC